MLGLGKLRRGENWGGSLRAPSPSVSFPALLAPHPPACEEGGGVPRDAWGCPFCSVPRWDSLVRCRGAGQSP